MSDAVWSGARAGDADKTLKPTFWGLGRSVLALAVLAGTGAALTLLPDNPGHPDHHIKGITAAIFGGVFAIRILYRAATGWFDLTIGPDGFSYGKTCYRWQTISGGFVAGTGWRRRNIVTFQAAGKTIQIVNCYGVSTPSFVALLNHHGPRTGGDDFAVAPPAVSKNLPTWVWIPILTVFVIVMLNIRMIANVSWLLFAPDSYADHLSDDTLGNMANISPALLSVLQKRAQDGDRSAMYFYGGFFDPDEFTCETAVSKNAATAIFWFRRAVMLDDQGAERSLGIMYHFGTGLPRDDVMAAQLFERAVAKNDDISEYYLGTMLEVGDGEPQNLARAAQLEEASAAQGNDDARSFLKQHGMQ